MMDANLAVQTEVEAAAKPKPNLRQRVESLRLPDDQEMHGTGHRWVWWLVGLAVVAVGGYFGYRALNQPEQQVARATNSNQPAENSTNSKGTSTVSPPVQSSTAASVASSGEIAHESKGYVVPAHQILVSPKVPGMITMLRIEEGQRVQKDDVLAQLETTDYDADFNRAKAAVASAEQRLLELEHGSRKEEIAQAQAELQEAEALRNQLAAELQRITLLHKSGVSTQSEYDLAEANFKTNDRRVERLRKGYDLMVIGPREERIAVARADLDIAKADLAKAQWRLDNTTIRAPVSGTILVKNAEEGNVVNPLVQHGTYSFCEMADLSDLEIELKIQERDVAKIFKGQKCKIRAEAWPDRVYDGYVSRLMPIADRSQGAVPVRVKVKVPPQEEGAYLKPEMGAVVSFLKRDEPSVK